MSQSTLTRLTVNYVMAVDHAEHQRALLGISEYLGALGNDRDSIEDWLAYSDALLPRPGPNLDSLIETEAIVLSMQGRLRTH